MRVRVVREAIRVRITGVRIAVRSIIGIAVRVMTARYRIVEVVRLVGIIVSGAAGNSSSYSSLFSSSNFIFFNALIVLGLIHILPLNVTNLLSYLQLL